MNRISSKIGQHAFDLMMKWVDDFIDLVNINKDLSGDESYHIAMIALSSFIPHMITGIIPQLFDEKKHNLNKIELFNNIFNTSRDVLNKNTKLSSNFYYN